MALSLLFCPLFVLFIPILVRRKASLLGTALTLRKGQGRLHSSSHSETSGSFPFMHRAYNIKCMEMKWWTKRTAAYMEIVANTSRVDLSQVRRDCSNIHYHG